MNFAPGMREAMSRAASIRAQRSPVRFITKGPRLNRRQDRPGIDLAVHHFVGIHGRRTRRRAHVASDRFHRFGRCIMAHAGAGTDDVGDRRPIVLHHCEHFFVFLPASAPKGDHSYATQRACAPQIKSDSTRSGKVAAKRHAIEPPSETPRDVSALDSDVVHHCADIVRPFLQCRHVHGAIGEAGAAFIEANEPAELAEALEEEGALRDFPIQVEMRHRARRPDHIEGSLARDLVGDANIATARILRFR